MPKCARQELLPEIDGEQLGTGVDGPVSDHGDGERRASTVCYDDSPNPSPGFIGSRLGPFGGGLFQHLR